MNSSPDECDAWSCHAVAGLMNKVDPVVRLVFAGISAVVPTL
jgi:hypothetical protein